MLLFVSLFASESCLPLENGTRITKCMFESIGTTTAAVFLTSSGIALRMNEVVFRDCVSSGNYAGGVYTANTAIYGNELVFTGCKSNYVQSLCQAVSSACSSINCTEYIANNGLGYTMFHGGDVLVSRYENTTNNLISKECSGFDEYCTNEGSVKYFVSNGNRDGFSTFYTQHNGLLINLFYVVTVNTTSQQSGRGFFFNRGINAIYSSCFFQIQSNAYATVWSGYIRFTGCVFSTETPSLAGYCDSSCVVSEENKITIDRMCITASSVFTVEKSTGFLRALLLFLFISQ